MPRSPLQHPVPGLGVAQLSTVPSIAPSAPTNAFGSPEAGDGALSREAPDRACLLGAAAGWQML